MYRMALICASFNEMLLNSAVRCSLRSSEEEASDSEMVRRRCPSATELQERADLGPKKLRRLVLILSYELMCCPLDVHLNPKKANKVQPK